MKRVLAAVCLFLCSAATGCGSRSGLTPEQLYVTCPTTAVRVLVGQATRIAVPGADLLHAYLHEWELITAPTGSAATLASASRGAALFTPDVAGSYGLRYATQSFRGDFQTCDVAVEATTGPIVTCAIEPVTADAEGNAALKVVVVSASPATVNWSLVDAPEGTGAAVTPGPTSGEASFEAAVPGTYRVRVNVSSAEGADSCELTVTVANDPRLRAICPSTLEVPPLASVEREGGAYNATEPGYEWTLLSAPVGSSVTMAATSGPLVEITPDIVGDYVLELRVTDATGAEDSCRSTVRATTQEGLRVEMFWLEDQHDVDLHLLHPDGTRWFHPVWDCYYASCKDGGLDWFDPGMADDPSLDIDDLDGFGPENINIPEPQARTYRVAVHNYVLSSSLPWEPPPNSTAVVRVYCGVGSTTPIWESAPTVLVGEDAFWWVADVTVRHNGCSVAPLGEIGTRLESEDRR